MGPGRNNLLSLMYEQFMNIDKIGLCNSRRDGPRRDAVNNGDMARDGL